MAEIGLDDLAYRLRMDTAQFFDSRRREKRSVALVRGSPTASQKGIKHVSASPGSKSSCRNHRLRFSASQSHPLSSVAVGDSDVGFTL